MIAQLLYGCGMRISEALRLRVKDLDFENRMIAIHQSPVDGTPVDEASKASSKEGYRYKPKDVSPSGDGRHKVHQARKHKRQKIPPASHCRIQCGRIVVRLRFSQDWHFNRRTNCDLWGT